MTAVEKFSGTREAGTHSSLIGMTCDALAHFSVFDSDLELVLVDIQGIISTAIHPEDGGRGSKVLNLFDLMFHSADGSFGLGDAGVQGIRGFFTKHKCNKICAALGLPIGQGCNSGGQTCQFWPVLTSSSAPVLRPENWQNQPQNRV